MNQSQESSTFTIRDPTLGQIVWSKLHRNVVAGDNTDKMLPHLAGHMRYNLMSVFKLYTKLSPWKGLDDNATQLDYFFTRSHKYNKGKL